MNAKLQPPDKLVRRALLGAVLAATCLSASAASFDCTKARSKSERLVCGDPRLSALDDRLAALAAAGKQRATSPRAYQRALDAAWSVRQKCEDIVCVESWYAQRIAELSNGEAEPVTPVETTPKLSAAAATKKPNVSPGAELLVIGAELGFDIPLTRQDFLDRYDASGGECGVSGHLQGLKALSRAAQSDCWTGEQCPAPAAGLRCQVLRTAYDSTGRIVLFTTTLSTVDANRAEGARDMGKIVGKFAEVGGGETRRGDVEDGRALSLSGIVGQYKLAVEVAVADGAKLVGTFSVAANHSP